MRNVVVAVKLPEVTVNNINNINNQLFGHILSAQQVNCPYLLMHYLGDVLDSDIVYVVNALNNIASSQAPLISLSGLVSVRHNNQIVVRIKAPKLVEMHELLSVELDKLGYNVERAYRPYLPLFKSVKLDMPYREVVKVVNIYNKPVVADTVQLLSVDKDITELYSITFAN